MILLDAVNYLRTNILYDNGGIGVTWDTYDDTDSSSFQMRWTNEELVSNINESVYQVYRRILPIKEINSLFDITTLEGVNSYTLDSRILQVESVRSSSTGKVLPIVDIKDVWDDSKLFTAQSKPDKVVLDYNTHTISFYPSPLLEEVDTYNLLVYRLPLSRLDWDNADDDIELREEFVIPMLNYAAHLCYNKDEVNTLDPNRSMFFLQKFNQEFPFTSAYSDVRKRRTTNRAVKYGGY